MTHALVDYANAHLARCQTKADILIAEGAMTYNRVAEHLVRARIEQSGDPTNAIAMLMRAVRDAEVHATEQECMAIVLDELAEAQRRIGKRLIEAAERRANTGGEFPIAEDAA